MRTSSFKFPKGYLSIDEKQWLEERTFRKRSERPPRFKAERHERMVEAYEAAHQVARRAPNPPAARRVDKEVREEFELQLQMDAYTRARLQDLRIPERLQDRVRRSVQRRYGI